MKSIEINHPAIGVHHLWNPQESAAGLPEPPSAPWSDWSGSRERNILVIYSWFFGGISGFSMGFSWILVDVQGIVVDISWILVDFQWMLMDISGEE
jgi:hypothetical protein